MNRIANEADRQTDAFEARDVVIRARGLSLRSGHEPAFSGVSFDVSRGDLFVLTGNAGAGKTALALALAGRLTVSGSLRVLGRDLPRGAGAVRHRVAFTGNSTVASLDDALTVEQHIAEAVVLNGPWWKPATSSHTVAAIVERANAIIVGLDDAGLDHRIAPLAPDSLIATVQPLPRLVLSVVLALLSEPEIVVIDDVDLLRDARDRRLAWHTLATLTTPRLSGLTIVATCQAPAELRAATDHLFRARSASDFRPVVEFELAVPVPTPVSLPSSPTDRAVEAQ